MSDSVTPPNSNEPRRRPWIWLSLIGLVIVAAVVAALVFLGQNGASAEAAATDPLNFAEVVITDLTQEEIFNGKLESIGGTGTVIPTSQIELSFASPGTLAELMVQVGQEVQAGDVLARLDTTDLERAVTQAEINLRQAEISLGAAQEPPDAATLQAAQDAVDQTAAALRLEQINHEAAMGGTLVTQALPDAQQNYEERLAEYNDWLEKYNDGEADYWFVDQALQAFENAEAALTSVELAVEQTTQSANNNLAQAADQYNQAKAALDGLLAGADAHTIENLELQVQAAEINLEAAQEALADATLVAPFDGVVTAVAAEVGQTVGGSMTVVTLVDLTPPKVEIFFDETNLDKVAVGTEVEVVFSALPTEQFTGTVALVDPQLTQSGDLSAMRALVQLEGSHDQALPAGLTAAVYVVGLSNRIVRVFLPLDDEDLLAVGDPVTVELPDSTGIPGTVVFVPQAPTPSVSGPAVFEVLVELDSESGLDDPTAASELAGLPDETFVDVIFVSDAVQDVMAIPVSALVALLEGGYAVEVDAGGGRTQLVAVEVGFFGSNNMIAINSEALQPGDQVVVP